MIPVKTLALSKMKIKNKSIVIRNTKIVIKVTLEFFPFSLFLQKHQSCREQCNIWLVSLLEIYVRIYFKHPCKIKLANILNCLYIVMSLFIKFIKQKEFQDRKSHFQLWEIRKKKSHYDNKYTITVTLI